MNRLSEDCCGIEENQCFPMHRLRVTFAQSWDSQRLFGGPRRTATVFCMLAWLGGSGCAEAKGFIAQICAMTTWPVDARAQQPTIPIFGPEDHEAPHSSKRHVAIGTKSFVIMTRSGPS